MIRELSWYVGCEKGNNIMIVKKEQTSKLMTGKLSCRYYIYLVVKNQGRCAQIEFV